MGLSESISRFIGRNITYRKDKEGNHWYIQDLHGIGFGDRKVLDLLGGMYNFDMRDDMHKAISMSVCTPISTVIDKAGSLFSNGRFYVVDKDGNESESNNDIDRLLKNPNVMQTGRQFFKQVEMSLKLFGYCPIYTLRATRNSLPGQLWIIPPELFHITSTGKLFKQNELKRIIKRAYVQFAGEEIELSEEEYFIIYDSEAILLKEEDSEIIFRSTTDSLSFPVSNWVAQMAASNTLIVDGGPKGIVHNDDSSEFANTALTSGEQKKLNDQFKGKYGLVGKNFSILVTKAKLGWIPLNYDSGQLLLMEEDSRCTEKIANAIGINPNLFIANSKYENQEAAERKAYQSLIIPDSEVISEALTNVLCPEGIYVKIDYTHVSCLQKDRKESASALSMVSNALSKLVEGGLITKDEARVELATYMEINPDKPKGEFDNGTNE